MIIDPYRRVAADTLSVILLHFDSSPFVDSSSYARTVDAVGGLSLDTGVYQFGPGSGVSIGSGQLAFLDAPEFALGTSDFCVEGWCKFDTDGARQFLVGQSDSSGTDISTSFYVQRNADKTITAGCYSGSTAVGTCTSTGTIEVGSFVHYAYTRSGSNFRLFIAGTQDGSASSGASVNDSSNDLVICRLGEFGGDAFSGNYDEFRMRIGDPVYTANFTPSGPFAF
jgi:hypothetical protein